MIKIHGGVVSFLSVDEYKELLAKFNSTEYVTINNWNRVENSQFLTPFNSKIVNGCEYPEKHIKQSCMLFNVLNLKYTIKCPIKGIYPCFFVSDDFIIAIGPIKQ